MKGVDQKPDYYHLHHVIDDGIAHVGHYYNLIKYLRQTVTIITRFCVYIIR